ncbi:hypothetical protein H0H93_016718 [Arthromyces matolae]|nr:hypothetical protein H0H93_016718 [Arthromyces matolae]
MFIATLRSQLKAPRSSHIQAAIRVQLALSRACSSSPVNRKGSTWETLNRIPTPACLDSVNIDGNEHKAFFPSEIEALYRGNQRFRDAVAASATPNVLRDLAAKGQTRVGEQVIFSAEPGTLFTTGNVANQFHEHDLNSKAVLAYAVDSLRVKHVVVMGHYGCGGVAAATLPHEAQDQDDPVQAWIAPIRHIYETSDRPEIAQHRAVRRKSDKPLLPRLHDAGFRALVEENVKANVRRIARSGVITNVRFLFCQHERCY